MTNAVKLLTLIYILFLLLSSLSGSIAGVSADYVPGAVTDVVSRTVGVLAYAFPAFIGFYMAPRFKREREEERGLVEELKTYLAIKPRSFRVFLPLVAPLVAVIMLVSYLSTLLLTLVGAEGTMEIGGSVPLAVLEYALIPAILEELLFRFLPLCLLLPYGRRECVLLSSLFFALIHCNFFSIPYAFLAGLVFIVVDIACESVIPSVILHLLNNIAGVIWLYCTDTASVIIFLSVLVGLIIVSLPFVFKGRKDYADMVRSAFVKGEPIRTLTPIVLIGLCVVSASLNLIPMGA